MTKLKKTKVILKHTLTVQENLRTGQLEAAVSIQEREDLPTSKTEGQYLATALYWLITERPEKVEDIYKEYAEYLNQKAEDSEVVH